MPLSFIVEWFLKKFHYRNLADAVAPKKRGLFEGTPVSTFFIESQSKLTLTS